MVDCGAKSGRLFAYQNTDVGYLPFHPGKKIDLGYKVFEVWFIIRFTLSNSQMWLELGVLLAKSRQNFPADGFDFFTAFAATSRVNCAVTFVRKETVGISTS
jgi:hypothetical protein